MHWLIFEDLGFTMRTPLLMKVFFMGELSAEESIRFFETFKNDMKNYLAGLQVADQYIDNFSVLIPEKEKSVYWEMTLDFGKRSMHMYMEWAESCITKLKSVNL